MPPVERQPIQKGDRHDPVVLWRASRLRVAGLGAELADALAVCDEDHASVLALVADERPSRG
jgi:hypothetical protein